MNSQPSERQEREFSDRYKPGHSGRDAAETSAFHAYASIGEWLRAYPVSGLDKKALSERLAREMASERPARPRRSSPLNWRPAPALTVAFTGVCMILLVVGLIQLMPLLRTPATSPVETFVLIDESSSITQDAPLFWRHRLQRGRLVTVPNGSSIELHLADGSTVTCSAGTRLAIRIGTDRRIVLDTGSLTVQANSIPGSTMTVETPLGDAVVVGTVFTITVNRHRDPQREDPVRPSRVPE